MMATVDELLRGAIARLRASGSESPRLDAELLLARAVGTDRTGILAHPEAFVGAGPAETFEGDLVRRLAGEPVAYIRGLKEFHGLAFAADARALIPRPETERVVEIAEVEVVRRLTGAPRPAGSPLLRVVDVGTGSGTIAVTLAVVLRARGMLDDVAIVATDLAPEALQLARENAVAHGVADRIEFVEVDLLPREADPFDVVAANLPYVASDAVEVLPVAASFEPRLALDGGGDGLEVIRRLLARLPTALRPDGSAVLEIGADQADDVSEVVDELLPGWACEVIPDLAGSPRVARIARPAEGG